MAVYTSVLGITCVFFRLMDKGPDFVLCNLAPTPISYSLLAGAIYLAYCLNRPDRIPFVFTALPALTGLMSYLRLAWRSTVVETPERLLLRSPGLVISLAAWLVLVGWFTAAVE